MTHRKLKVELTLTVPGNVSDTKALKALNAILDVGYADAAATEGTDFAGPCTDIAASLKVGRPRVVRERNRQ